MWSIIVVVLGSRSLWLCWLNLICVIMISHILDLIDVLLKQHTISLMSWWGHAHFKVLKPLQLTLSKGCKVGVLPHDVEYFNEVVRVSPNRNQKRIDLNRDSYEHWGLDVIGCGYMNKLLVVGTKGRKHCSHRISTIPIFRASAHMVQVKVWVCVGVLVHLG